MYYIFSISKYTQREFSFIYTHTQHLLIYLPVGAFTGPQSLTSNQATEKLPFNRRKPWAGPRSGRFALFTPECASEDSFIVWCLLFLRKPQHGCSGVDGNFNTFLLRNDQNVAGATRRRRCWSVSVLHHGRSKAESKRTQKSNTTTLLRWTSPGSLQRFARAHADHFWCGISSSDRDGAGGEAVVLLGRDPPANSGSQLEMQSWFIQSSRQTNWPPTGNKR